jgi:hypothetical protein
MRFEKRSAHDVMAKFIADVSSGKRSKDNQLEAILLEHVLLQAGYKIVPRHPDELVLRAGAHAESPDEAWISMWDAFGAFDPEMTENYTPA